MKMLELCNYCSMEGNTYEDFLPSWIEFSSNHLSYRSPLTFNKENIEALVIARNNYYENMQEKLKKFLADLEVRYQQVITSLKYRFFLVFVWMMNLIVYCNGNFISCCHIFHQFVHYSVLLVAICYPWGNVPEKNHNLACRHKKVVETVLLCQIFHSNKEEKKVI